MNILMLYPKYPEATFWNANSAQWVFERRRANLPPLGLLTVASYLPDDFDIRMVDRNIENETEADWDWADVVFLSLMGIQKEDYRRCVAKAKENNIPIAIGGPFTHAFQEESAADGDWICVGEAEDIMEEFIADLRANNRGKRYDGGNKTNMETVKTPRYDLLKNLNDYGAMAIQFSRGCPYMCEFCDIIEIYGRVPRTKTPAQIIAELEEIKKFGYHGYIFIVDDNFIGNKKKAMVMLEELASWNNRQEFLYKYMTEASLNLADEPELLEKMALANMQMVFIGIETPDPKLLKTTKKLQNASGNHIAKFQRIRDFGIHITGGFIVGFDNEDRRIFEVQRDFIQEAGVGVAMMGLLLALPHTQLSRRLKKEGRLLEKFAPMEMTVDGINFIPKGEMTKRDYLTHYSQLIKAIYEPRPFFERILPAALKLNRKRQPAKFNLKVVARDMRIFLRHLYHFGLKEKGCRKYYWRGLATLLLKNPLAIEAFVFDCFFYYHLKRHGKFIQRHLAAYLKNPSPDDVLDEVITEKTVPTPQLVSA
jgi:radical SAM superfamily enzyme YgiQ (UPF0313 family)